MVLVTIHQSITNIIRQCGILALALHSFRKTFIELRLLNASLDQKEIVICSYIFLSYSNVYVNIIIVITVVVIVVVDK